MSDPTPVYYADLTGTQRAELAAWGYADLAPDADVLPVLLQIRDELQRAREVFDSAPEGDGWKALAVMANRAHNEVWEGSDDVLRLRVFLVALAHVDYYENPYYQSIDPRGGDDGAGYWASRGMPPDHTLFIDPRPDVFRFGVKERPAVLGALPGERSPGREAKVSCILVAREAVRLVNEAAPGTYTFTGRTPYAGNRAKRTYPAPLVKDLAEHFGLKPKAVREKLDRAGVTEHSAWGPLRFGTRKGEGRRRAARKRRR